MPKDGKPDKDKKDQYERKYHYERFNKNKDRPRPPTE